LAPTKVRASAKNKAAANSARFRSGRMTAGLTATAVSAATQVARPANTPNW
jgi:hypothetical protein